jgi:hypothetical protein
MSDFEPLRLLGSGDKYRLAVQLPTLAHGYDDPYNYGPICKIVIAVAAQW